MNYEAEISVIGSLLIDSEYSYPLIMAELTPDDFINPDCKEILECAVELNHEGKKIDPITIKEIAGARIGADFLMSAMDLTPTSANLRGWIEIVKNQSKRRRAKEIVDNLSLGLLEHADMGEIQAKATQLANILTESGDGDELTIAEGMKRFYEEKEKPKEYIKTGFSTLDRKIFVDQGDYIVIGGRPSAGKTAFSLNLAMKLSLKYNVVFFSLETKNGKIIDRIVAPCSNTEFSKIKEHRLDQTDWNRIVASKIATGRRFTAITAAGRNVAWIQAKAEKLKADIIFIDYLGLIRAEGKGRYEKVTNISVDLHVMAQRTGITVFALSQLNRNGIGIPTMEDLRESGQIEQDKTTKLVA